MWLQFNKLQEGCEESSCSIDVKTEPPQPPSTGRRKFCLESCFLCITVSKRFVGNADKRCGKLLLWAAWRDGGGVSRVGLGASAPADSACPSRPWRTLPPALRAASMSSWGHLMGWVCWRRETTSSSEQCSWNVLYDNRSVEKCSGSFYSVEVSEATILKIQCPRNFPGVLKTSVHWCALTIYENWTVLLLPPGVPSCGSTWRKPWKWS